MALSPLAERILADHQQKPKSYFYDLWALGSMIEVQQIADIDAAYDELVAANLVKRAQDVVVSVLGHPKPVFRVAESVTTGSSAR